MAHAKRVEQLPLSQAECVVRVPKSGTLKAESAARAIWARVCRRAVDATLTWFKTNWLGATGVSAIVLVAAQLIAWRFLGADTVKSNLEAPGTTLAGLVAISVLFFALQLVRVPVVIDEEREGEARGLRADVYALREKLAPRLTVFFDKTVAECFDVVSTGRSEGRPTTRRLCRVGIRNESGAALRSVRVRGAIIPTGGLGRVPLRVMHDRATPPTTEVTLNPYETMFVDVALQEHGYAREGSDRVVLCYAVDGIPNILQPGRHTIEISVTAADTAPCERRFTIDVDEDRRLMPSSRPSTEGCMNPLAQGLIVANRRRARFGRGSRFARSTVGGPAGAQRRSTRFKPMVAEVPTWTRAPIRSP